MSRLTEAEKKARGTHKKCRTLVPRTLEIIRAEIADMEQAIDDMRYTLSLTVGESRKKDAMASLRSLKRMVEFLREEEKLAEVKINREEAFEEFAHLVR